ncbi:hypothetical protein [Paraburkholderia sp. J8-2]|uniref:hypothetical protein n=1 Tax=Paraburkholderia sp. J8-2 TaxID=2805440 RepID=UPI002AB6B89C|nr:hypothetical protein [Paraburkholderia sp. J8-2]
MDANLVKGIAATTGVAGIALATLVQVLRPILHKSVLASMSKADAYKLLRVIVFGCVAIAIIGIVAWVISPSIVMATPEDNGGTVIRQTTSGNCSAAIAGVKGNISINGDCAK